MSEKQVSQLLVPARQAATKLGITRQTLKSRIYTGLIRAVKVGDRSYIPQTEIDRIVSGELSPEPAIEIRQQDKMGKKVTECNKLTPKQRTDAILHSVQDLRDK